MRVHRTVALRRAEVARLLRKGKTNIRALAEIVGASKSTIHRDIEALMAELRESRIDDVAHCRAIEADRLDALQESIWDEAVIENPKDKAARDSAIDRILKISKRRSELLGLDQPARSEITVDLSKLSPEKLAEALNCLGTDQILAALAALDSGEGAGEAGGGSD